MSQDAVPTAPRFEHHDAGPVLGIGTATPRLSWIVPTADPDYVQRSYRVEVRVGDAEPQVTTVDSGEQVLVDWPGAPLRSRRARDGPGGRERRRVERAGGRRGGTAGCGRLVRPLHQPGRRSAGWSSRPRSCRGRITCPATSSRPGSTSPRTASTRPSSTASGSATSSSPRAGPRYEHRLRYQTYDVTDLVRQRREQPRRAARQRLVPRPARLPRASARLRRPAGAAGPARGDHRRRAGPRAAPPTAAGPPGRARSSPTTCTTASTSTCAAPTVGSSRPVEEIAGRPGPPGRPGRPAGPGHRGAAGASTSPARDGKTLVDFGQNLVGWVRLRPCAAQAGQRVTVRHAEVLENGELGVRPLRTAKATDSWILAGDDEVTLEPTLTFHGFRYAEVTGADGGHDRTSRPWWSAPT